jgi:hypothetical protein
MVYGCDAIEKVAGYISQVGTESDGLLHEEMRAVQPVIRR